MGDALIPEQNESLPAGVMEDVKEIRGGGMHPRPQSGLPEKAAQRKLIIRHDLQMDPFICRDLQVDPYLV